MLIYGSCQTKVDATKHHKKKYSAEKNCLFFFAHLYSDRCVEDEDINKILYSSYVSVNLKSGV